MTNNYLQAKIGKHDKLEVALQSLRGKNVDISEEAAEIIVIFQLIFFSITLSQKETNGKLFFVSIINL